MKETAVNTQNPGVADIVAAVMQSLAPVLKEVALTKEKIEELKKPYVDPKLEARDKREREYNRQQFLEGLRRTKERQDRCPHKDKNEKYSISLVHNYPDSMTRGVCMVCQKWFHPQRYEINAHGQAIIVEADPLYHIIEYLESVAVG